MLSFKKINLPKRVIALKFILLIVIWWTSQNWINLRPSWGDHLKLVIIIEGLSWAQIIKLYGEGCPSILWI